MKTRYPADWPRGLIEIAEAIGPELALLLAAHVGGISHYVPKEPQNSHKLARIIGLPALVKLAAIYGGVWLEIPKYAAAKTKRVKIRQLLKDGTSFRDAALRSDATVRYVTMVSRDLKNEAKQLSLFEV